MYIAVAGNGAANTVHSTFRTSSTFLQVWLVLQYLFARQDMRIACQDMLLVYIYLVYIWVKYMYFGAIHILW